MSNMSRLHRDQNTTNSGDALIGAMAGTDGRAKGGNFFGKGNLGQLEAPNQQDVLFDKTDPENDWPLMLDDFGDRERDTSKKLPGQSVSLFEFIYEMYGDPTDRNYWDLPGYNSPGAIVAPQKFVPADKFDKDDPRNYWGYGSLDNPNVYEDVVQNDTDENIHEKDIERGVKTLEQIQDFLIMNGRRLGSVLEKTDIGFLLPMSLIENSTDKDLLLLFSSSRGSRGAKYSRLDNGKSLITIWFDKPFSTPRQFLENLSEWFITRRDSFIHEYTHYIDFENTDNNEIKNFKNAGDEGYENHHDADPSERRSLITQGIYRLMNDLKEKPEVWLKDRLRINLGEESFKLRAINFYFSKELLNSIDQKKTDYLNKKITALYKTYRGSKERIEL